VYYQPVGGDDHAHLVEALFTGRLSVALGDLPVRLEGEVAIGLGYVDLRGAAWPCYNLVVIPAVAVSWQPLPWLEVALRPVRLELLGLAGTYPPLNSNHVPTENFALRLSLDAVVRFRY